MISGERLVSACQNGRAIGGHQRITRESRTASEPRREAPEILLSRLLHAAPISATMEGDDAQVGRVLGP
jgi:hypothetical protein